jgi:hypothetical protein
VKPIQSLNHVSEEWALRILCHMAAALGTTVVCPLRWPTVCKWPNTRGMYCSDSDRFNITGSAIALNGNAGAFVLAHEVGHRAFDLLGKQLPETRRRFHWYARGLQLTTLLNRVARRYDFSKHNRSTFDELHAEVTAFRLLGFDYLLPPSLLRLTERSWKTIIKPAFDRAVREIPPCR